MIGHSYLVVANRNKAKIFELKDHASSMLEVENIENSHGKALDQEMVTDRPGRISAPSAQVEGVDAMTGTDQREHNLNLFAARVAKKLDQRRKESKTYHFNIIAEPQFLGALRKKIDKQTEKLIRTTVNKDLVNASDDELLKYMKDAERQV
ncbi:host attachment protein [Bowmanella dokdonensis]|uniref:Host attachment protein n=1 Tax=Bowmanella dokdonensis TaxID=751969 RepID=A0A939DJJ4_9ALTE|nr:host attachment protein [Bowmanella dokdonensis]MBN7823878.1 host attachment protein [Bowmanella dokdonensis]